MLNAINACKALDIIFPDFDNEQELAKIALGFWHKSEMYIVDHCVGALDGLLVDLHCIVVDSEPEEDVFNAVEQRGDVAVPDRLSETDRPQRNANGAPVLALWYFPEAGAEETVSNISM